MDTYPESKSVQDLVELYRNKMLVANPEYQRGAVWSRTQKRKLIDSVPWEEVEIHHLEQHAHGGPTQIENGALVHRACHPKSLVATQALAAKIKGQRSAIKEALDLL